METITRDTGCGGRLAAIAFAARAEAERRELGDRLWAKQRAEREEAARRADAMREVERAADLLLPGEPITARLWATPPDYREWQAGWGISPLPQPHLVLAGRLVLVICAHCHLTAGLLPADADGRAPTLADLAAADWLRTGSGGWVTVYDRSHLAGLLSDIGGAS